MLLKYVPAPERTTQSKYTFQPQGTIKTRVRVLMFFVRKIEIVSWKYLVVGEQSNSGLKTRILYTSWLNIVRPSNLC